MGRPSYNRKIRPRLENDILYSLDEVVELAENLKLFAEEEDPTEQTFKMKKSLADFQRKYMGAPDSIIQETERWYGGAFKVNLQEGDFSESQGYTAWLEWKPNGGAVTSPQQPNSYSGLDKKQQATPSSHKRHQLLPSLRSVKTLPFGIRLKTVTILACIVFFGYIGYFFSKHHVSTKKYNTSGNYIVDMAQEESFPKEF